MSEAVVQVTEFDHLVLKVADVERSLGFYSGQLGLAPVRVEEWRAGQVPFPSVRVTSDTIIDLLARPEPAQPADQAQRADQESAANVDHLCLVVRPLDWQRVVDSGVFDVVDGPGQRYGARGNAESLYVRDPDGNVVELRWYPQDASPSPSPSTSTGA